MRGSATALAVAAAFAAAGCGQAEPPAAQGVVEIALPDEPEISGVRVDFVLAGGRPFASAWIADGKVVWEDTMPALERAYALFDEARGELVVVYPESQRWARLEPDVVQDVLARVGGIEEPAHQGRPHTVRPVMRDEGRAIAPCDWVVEQDDDMELAAACIAREAPPGLSENQARTLQALFREAGRLGPAISPVVWPLTRTDLVHGVPIEVLDADGGFHLLAQPAQPDDAAHERVEMPAGYTEIDIVAELVGITP